LERGLWEGDVGECNGQVVVYTPDVVLAVVV
jgi:hypothetical protein